jgi:Nucleoside 2-deoxyribosyltransferase like
MIITQAPESYDVNGIDLFLAGGISNCPDWQADAGSMLADVEGWALNPRRGGVFDPSSAEKQIMWEHKALKIAKAILFWFPKETLCPITLYELGVFSQRKHVPLFVGVHPEYARKLDVVIQLREERPEVVISFTVEDTVKAYKEYQKSLAVEAL